MPNFYEVLGVPKTASRDEIKKAYRKAALRTHPDRVPADQKKQAEDAFRAINAAYEILSNEGNRTLYDKHGVWPPPASSSSKSKPYKTKTREPEYRPMQNPYESDAGGAAYQHFVFTDPFALFNMIFADMYQQQQAAAAAYHMRRPQAVPVYPDPYAAQHYAQFPSFSQSATQFPTQSAPPPQPPQAHHRSQPASRTESPANSDDASSGWIKESKVTKITPQGTRETTIKKTAPDGTVYITRIADNATRHYILVNGVEKPSATAPPVTPPRVPLSQTQASGQAPFPRADFGPSPQSERRRSSSRHTPSASQPVNSIPTTRDRSSASAAPSYSTQPAQPSHPPTSGVTSSGGHRRSSSRAGQSSAYPMNYRAASPTPMAPHEAAPGVARAFVHTTGRRATSPGPKSASFSGSGSDSAPRSKATVEPLKRNHTLPGHIVQEATGSGGIMPRPQSPHFYRTRTTSEQRKMTDPTPPKVASYRPKETREDPMHIMSDNEASRGRPAMYRPSRSSSTYPVPDPNQHRPMSTQPHHISQYPQAVPPTAPKIVQQSTQPIYQPNHTGTGHHHHQSVPQAQSAPPPPPPKTQPVVAQVQQAVPPQPRPAGHRSSHHTHKAQPPPPLDDMPITNGLGLGFVPPPSAGFASNRSSYASNGPNPPLTKSSRNNSYEEIVYPHRSKPSVYATHSSQPQTQYVYAGNPMPNPPMSGNPQVARDPWVTDAQPVRYRQTAA